MKGINDAFVDRQTELRRMRDTLRVRLHLASKEARETFHDLEAKWQEVEVSVAQLKLASTDRAKAVEEKAEALLDEIKEGYARAMKEV